MLAVSLVVGVSRSTALRGLKGSARPIQRVGSAVMLLVRAGLIYSTMQPDVLRSVFFPG